MIKTKKVVVKKSPKIKVEKVKVKIVKTQKKFEPNILTPPSMPEKLKDGEAHPVIEDIEVKSVPVIFDGLEVTKILEEGHSDQYYHCRMSDGSTRHVPRTLIDSNV